ncbi:regulatory inactivation of DnaA Hda protein [Alteromonadaceae bacterium Bs31]|nr:regulatory inactivation of DnaA Hda protein [Alteromonadaceae bacterium Bs31]
MSTSAPQQLSLGVSLRDEATFENYFVSGDVNSQAISALKNLSENLLLGAGPQFLVIWGARGAGLSHLVQAVCHSVGSKASIQYLPMADVRGYAADDLCDGLEQMDLVCLDGIEHICGNREWEQAIFHLYNRLKDGGKSLLIASHTSPPSLPIFLADLKSRVLGCTIFHVESLSDEAKMQALSMRAAARGFQLPEEVANYILKRSARDMVELFAILNQLDDASLQEQRRLTIPFVKDILGY